MAWERFPAVWSGKRPFDRLGRMLSMREAKPKVPEAQRKDTVRIELTHLHVEPGGTLRVLKNRISCITKTAQR